MSLFLGKIHYWLYNKIRWFEELEKEVVRGAKENGMAMDEFVKEVGERYGEPIGNKPLEEVIDTGNIHGWLQEKIQGAELRQAAVITRVLTEKPELKDSIMEIFSKQGREAAMEYGGNVEIPQEAFNALNDFLLEGMPCDRVNEVISSSDDEFEWQTTECLHKPYWNEVRGDVRNFYDLREAWVKAFVSTLNPAFRYEKPEADLNRIVREG